MAGPPGVTERYRPIADYGVIGDLRTAALVSRDGSVDWWCLPRFNDPSVFAALLDADRGGRWRIGPAAAATSEQRYLPGTNVLVTTFHLEAGGAAAVTDFLPMGPARGAEPVIFRRVAGHRGRVPMATRFQPRFEYGREAARFTMRRAGLIATESGRALALSAWPELEWSLEGDATTATFELGAGEERWFVLRWDHDETPAAVTLGPQAALDATIGYWDAWVAPLDYHGPYRAEVQRSALALKLLQYEPSGAIVAAPTTSLPEWIGAGRNWDYRFTWLRDSAYVLYALDSLGILSEADAFQRFLLRALRRDDASHLQVLYAPHGDREADERVLDHLEGYAGSAPVRVGNGAATQFQLDVYGELLDTIAIAHRTREPGEAAWSSVERLVDWVAENWGRPDWGIWEARLEPRHHVCSKVMAWAALDRGASLAEQYGLRGDGARWRAEAAAVKAEVLEQGWDPARSTFVQAYGEPGLDASTLVIPKVRFLPRTDPRVRGTLEAIRRELGAGPEELIYRYRSPDGLAGDEGAFVACSFWMIQNVALTGDFEEAERLFRLLLRRASPVGLFAEEIDPRTGDHLGNYPLGLSHAALINTAVMLERLRGRG
ncbi:MAG TPA: glycoside hydrolase family 15 protein [Gemmatimonadales bacterium]|nr:glycoside hydrolase family 15 protein [Gemmatimonadales bacterium]